MPYKTIIVNLDAIDAAGSALKAAVHVAEQHNAHLLGTFIVHPGTPYAGLSSDLGVPFETDQVVNDRHDEQAAHLQSLFKSETASRLFVSEWRYVGDSLTDTDRTLLSIGSCADLLIVGGFYKQDNTVLNTDHGSLTRILSGSACPVLVIPTKYLPDSLGGHVLLAYDGGRESSRAILDSVPMLQTAQDVWLHSVQGPGIDSLHIDNNVRDLADALSRHGITVEVSTSKAHTRETGKQLLSVAADHGADCMVMGAPAHSRLRDVFLGSAARYALEKSKLPVLFSS